MTFEEEYAALWKDVLERSERLEIGDNKHEDAVADALRDCEDAFRDLADWLEDWKRRQEESK